MCDRAAAHGLLVAIEFFAMDGDSRPCERQKRSAGWPDGAMAGCWWTHGITSTAAADARQRCAPYPPIKIVAIQFDDAARIAPTADMLYDTLHRSMPGEGVFDLVGFIRLLDEIGVQAPISVEIIAPEQQQRPLEEAARHGTPHDTNAAVNAPAPARPGAVASGVRKRPRSHCPTGHGNEWWSSSRAFPSGVVARAKKARASTTGRDACPTICRHPNPVAARKVSTFLLYFSSAVTGKNGALFWAPREFYPAPPSEARDLGIESSAAEEQRGGQQEVGKEKRRRR